MRFIEYDPYSFMPHIGIASGKITLGSICFKDFVSYSAYGSTVNLASRFAKESEARMITLSKEIIKSSDSIKRIIQETVRFHDKWDIQENVKNIKGFGETSFISVQREETIDFIFELDDVGGISKSITIIDEITSELSDLKEKGKYLPI